jgi:hypothetical protein
VSVEAELAAELAAEIERVHQFLDEHGIGDGTEPLLERVGQAINMAYVQGLQGGGWPGAPAE